MFKGIKNNNLISLRKVLTILLFAMFFIPKTAFAYTITFDADGAKFDNGNITNAVEYDSSHNVTSGTYKEPYLGSTTSYEFYWSRDQKGTKKVTDLNTINSDTTLYAKYVSIIWDFGYTGNEQIFTSPITKKLKLETWGAQGGNATTADYSPIGGYGAYSIGYYPFTIDDTYYVVVGGQPDEATEKIQSHLWAGGYNGGGTGRNSNQLPRIMAGGGGATHIATVPGLLKDLESYKGELIGSVGNGDSYYKSNEIIIVAAGGSGAFISATSMSNGGHGGGYKSSGATQTTGYAFGLGQQHFETTGTINQTGAGGGFYGGTGAAPGHGGSSYIANPDLTYKYMAGYGASTSTNSEIKTISVNKANELPLSDNAKIGNGAARISYVTHNVNVINDYDNLNINYYTGHGETTTPEPYTQRNGYSFNWYNGNEIFDFDTLVTEDITLVGVYTPITYNITYNVTGGAVSGNPDTYTIEDNDITLNNPTPNQTGYIFEGWTGTDLTEKTMTVTIPKGSIGDREYTAHFEKEKYTITYNLNGGELETGVTNPEEYYIDTPDITLNNPSKEGYTFIGWTGSNGTTPTNVIIASGSTGNKTYTANYQIDRHTATFDSNLGTTAVPETITKDYNEALGTLPTTSRTGYIFEGWFTEKESGTQISSTTKMPASNPTYYAHWTPITYTIHFNSNNGTGSMADETMTYGVSKALTENTFTRDGWTFAGWNTKADGSGTNYIDKQEIFNLTDVDGEEFTLFAKWTKDEYIINYDADGGQLENPKTTYSVDDEEFTLVQPTKEGYTFTGWTGTGVTNPTKNVVIPTGSTGNRDYTAHWTATVYTIEYINNVTGETVLVAGNPTSYTVEDSDITLNNAGDYDTYHFYVGWTSDKDTESDLSDSYVIRTNQMKNLKIYAIYQTSPYTVSFDSDGGNDIDPISRQGTEDVGPLPTPVKEGYIFKGWFVNNKLIDQTFHSRVDVTAIAKWEKIPDSVEPTIINPKTGDNIMKYLVLLLISLIGLGYTGYKFKLKTKKTQ